MTQKHIKFCYFQIQSAYPRPPFCGGSTPCPWVRIHIVKHNKKTRPMGVFFYCGGVGTFDGIRYDKYRVFTGNFYLFAVSIFARHAQFPPLLSKKKKKTGNYQRTSGNLIHYFLGNQLDHLGYLISPPDKILHNSHFLYPQPSLPLQTNRKLSKENNVCTKRIIYTIGKTYAMIAKYKVLRRYELYGLTPGIIW